MISFIRAFFFPPSEGFSDCSDSKESAGNAGDQGSIPGLQRYPQKGMAIHSSILTWRLPWTEEPSELQSMELQKVRHDWVTNIHKHSVW